MEDVEILLACGADKISVNSAAVKNPQLINDLALAFGSQCVVVAVDAKEVEGEWLVHLAGGRIATEIKLLDWCKEAESRGAGEILFTSMNHDGTKAGFANEALAKLSDEITLFTIKDGSHNNLNTFHDYHQWLGEVLEKV